MASSTFPSSLSALLSTTMYTPALLFRSLRISGPSIPPSTPSLPLLVSSLQPRSFSVHPPSLSTTLPPPTPFYTPRPKRATRSREASPSALAWSSEPTANAVKEFAHLAPVAPGVDTEQEKSNLELAGRFSDKTYTVDKPVSTKGFSTLGREREIYREDFHQLTWILLLIPFCRRSSWPIR